MMTKVLIVDDEEPARELLKSYVEKLDNLHLVATVSSALAAKRIIEQDEVDILVSDIQMEDLTGIDLLKTLKQAPVTIFTTAYSEYALEGFELDIADYLVKPVSFQRFCRAMDKAIELVSFQQAKTPNVSAGASTTDYFFVKTNRKMIKVAYADILFVESYGEYVKLYTNDDVILALQTTTFMEQRLPGEDFIRIHRSHIININQIKEIDGNTVVIDRHRLTVSKRQKEAFMKRIQEKGVI